VQLLVLGLQLFVVMSAAANEDYVRLQVAEPYVELHTGPGRGFPIDHVVDRYDWIEIIKRKTDWFKIRTREGKTGWVYIDQIELTLATPELQTKIEKVEQRHFLTRRYEAGVMGGELEEAEVLTVVAGMNLTPNLTIELGFSQASDSYIDTKMVNGNILSSPFPEWLVSPYVSLGVGYREVKPRETFVLAEKTDDMTANAGAGVRIYLTRRFMLRAEFRQYIVFTEDDDDNEELDEWHVGFSFFF
jgi:hypothetical protein